ncbi:MAG: sensor histidine kinase, partial [Myxococcota bacterium]
SSKSDRRPFALADARALDQVLGNLLDNALKYTEPGGSIEIAVEERLGRVRVSVADTGIGIPALDISRVFERFYRVLGTGVEGCGLGLAIVREIALSHGGGVTLADGAGGLGTVVRVAFPRAA